MADDLTPERIVEAAARGLCDDGMGQCIRMCDECPRKARAALAAVLREAGVDAEALRIAHAVISAHASWRRFYEAERTLPPDDLHRTDATERAAALLRALAGVADG